MELDVMCSVRDCTFPASVCIRWLAALIPVCESHADKQVREEPS